MNNFTIRMGTAVLLFAIWVWGYWNLIQIAEILRNYSENPSLVEVCGASVLEQYVSLVDKFSVVIGLLMLISIGLFVIHPRR